MKRPRVLAEDSDAAVAIKLKSNPGQWYAIAAGPVDRKHLYQQIAYRIRKGQQAAFRSEAGIFEATVTTDEARHDPVELVARYVPSESVEQPVEPVSALPLE